MRKSFVVSAACAALGLATMADAALVATFQVTNPGPLTGLPGYVGGVLRITSDSGNITAFDFGGTDAAKPQEALKGVFSSNSGGVHSDGLNQRWTAADDGLGNITFTPTPKGQFTPALLSNPGNRDSYFNQTIAETAIVYAAEEENSLGGSPLSSTNPPAGSAGVFWGLGDNLHYTTGISLAAQAPFIDLAYLVLPSSGFIHVNGEIAVGTKLPLNVIIPVPEPVTAGLMSLGGLALLARRRRI